jgi:hypothetical protein
MKRLALLLMLVAIPAGAAPEKWWEAYDRGIKAVNAKQYDAAVQALQKALAEMPTENTAARTRKEVITYVPHFWLGIAKFGLNDFDGALREWKISEDQGAIAKTEYYSRLRDYVARAQAEKVKLAQNAASGARKEADAALSRALSSQMEAVSAGGDRSETYRAANRKLNEAMGQFNAAGASIDAYNRAADTAGQAVTMFAKAAEDAKKAKASRPPAVATRAPAPQPQPVTVAATIPPPVLTTTQAPEAPKVVVVEPPPAPVPEPQPIPAAVVQTPVESEARVTARVALQQYRRRLAAMPPSRNAVVQELVRLANDSADRMQQELAATSDDATAQRIADSISTMEADLTAKLIAASPPPATNESRPQLESAYRAFAAGDLEGSERALSAILVTAPSGEAYLLRGCTRYTRALLSRNEALAAEATTDFKTALRLKRSLRLDRRLFSPKLVDFFDQLRKTL